MTSADPIRAQECPKHCPIHDMRYTSRPLPGGGWTICPACEHDRPAKKRGGLASLIATAGKTERDARCQEHGPYRSTNFIGNVWSQCPACAEREAAERKNREAAKTRAESVLRWRSLVGHSLMPERFADRTLGSFKAECEGQRRVISFAEGYSADFAAELRRGRCLLLCGKPGTGKTHIAVGIANRIMQDGYTALFTTALRAVRRVKESWQRNAKETESQAISAMVFPDLLILDEVGVQFGSEAERTILFDLLNERYERRKPTIFLSNLAPAELEPFLGERVFSRLREDGGKFFPFDWDDYRAKAL